MATDFVKVDAILGIKDFKTVYKLVREARRRWREIGIEFDISLSDLNDIEDRYGRGDSDRCLQAVLEKWLREYPIMPTWNTLIEVLREDTVKEEGVAEDVEKHVKSYNQKTPAGACSQTSDVRQGMVSIEGEEYSLSEAPAEKSALVLAETKRILGTIDFDELESSLSTMGRFIGIIYNGIGIAGPEFVDLQAEVLHISSNVTRLCDDSTPTMAAIKAGLTQLNDLAKVHQDLITNYEGRALTSLIASVTAAGKVKEAAETMLNEFEKQCGKVEAAIYTESIQARMIQL